METIGVPARARVYSLDLVRFVAAFAVVAYHYAAFGYKFTGERIAAVAPVAKYGYLGVDLFFLISGFVVLMSALGRTPRQFFNSRFTRVVPMFWLACLITAAVMALLGQPPALSTVGWNLSLVTITPIQMLLQRPFLDGVYWTLTVETTFYVLVWLALMTGLIRHVRPLLYGWLAFTVLGQFLPDGTISKILTGIFITRYAAYFIAGGLFYLIWKERRVRALDVVALLVAWGLSVYLAVWFGAEVEQFAGFSQSPTSIALIVTALYGLFALVSSGSLPEERLKRWAWLGALTYPLYLLHQNIGYALINKFKLVMPGELAITLMFALALLMAWAAHKWLEVPFTKWVKVRIERILPGKAALPAERSSAV